MNRINIICIAIVLAVSVFVITNAQPQEHRGSVCFGIECFSVEIADTDIRRKQGLMFRKNIDKNTGMLFIFEKENTYGFWMKNTYMPLDIIWMNREKEVVFIERSARPCLKNSCTPVFPDRPALYVLEINATEQAVLGLRIGDKAVFDIK